MGIDSARVDIRSVDSVPIILKGVLGPLILLRDGGMVGAPFGKEKTKLTPLVSTLAYNASVSLAMNFTMLAKLTV